jgi:uncharacterized protein YeaO (DUF488 family)
MSVKTKCIYDKREKADGVRILITTYWPRGISKDKIDRWEKELGTPPDLIKKWKSGSINWPAFSRLYLSAVRLKKDKIQELADLARQKDITLLCTCRDGEHCHRKLLKEMVENK